MVCLEGLLKKLSAECQNFTDVPPLLFKGVPLLHYSVSRLDPVSCTGRFKVDPALDERFIYPMEGEICEAVGGK
jgi:hypothetical protein